MSPRHPEERNRVPDRVPGASLALNLVLALIKVTAGIAGNSYALVADGIESTVDVISSLVVWGGLRIAAQPPDDAHPYGHGKADTLAAVLVGLLLVAAAALIAVQSVREIVTPHHAPAPYTLAVLVGVIVVKESMFRYVNRAGEEAGSGALRADAWHHRSDAITSLAAFVGITVAILGGPGFEPADDWAALVACGVILFNAVRLLRSSLDEVLDAAVPPEIEHAIRRVAREVPGVHDVEKTRVRRSGTGLLMDIHVEVDGNLTVRRGHDIGHEVSDRILASGLGVVDVVVHIEPEADPASPRPPLVGGRGTG